MLAHLACALGSSLTRTASARSSRWGTAEYRWADVTGFLVHTQPEAEDSFGFWILKDGQDTEKLRVISGAYGDRVKSLAERLNAARAKALGDGATRTTRQQS